jgi:hypothetical protein
MELFNHKNKNGRFASANSRKPLQDIVGQAGVNRRIQLPTDSEVVEVLARHPQDVQQGANIITQPTTIYTPNTDIVIVTDASKIPTAQNLALAKQIESNYLESKMTVLSQLKNTARQVGQGMKDIAGYVSDAAKNMTGADALGIAASAALIVMPAVAYGANNSKTLVDNGQIVPGTMTFNSEEVLNNFNENYSTARVIQITSNNFPSVRLGDEAWMTKIAQEAGLDMKNPELRNAYLKASLESTKEFQKELNADIQRYGSANFDKIQPTDLIMIQADINQNDSLDTSAEEKLFSYITELSPNGQPVVLTSQAYQELFNDVGNAQAKIDSVSTKVDSLTAQVRRNSRAFENWAKPDSTKLELDKNSVQGQIIEQYRTSDFLTEDEFTKITGVRRDSTTNKDSEKFYAIINNQAPLSNLNKTKQDVLVNRLEVKEVLFQVPSMKNEDIGTYINDPKQELTTQVDNIVAVYESVKAEKSVADYKPTNKLVKEMIVDLKNAKKAIKSAYKETIKANKNAIKSLVNDEDVMNKIVNQYVQQGTIEDNFNAKANLELELRSKSYKFKSAYETVFKTEIAMEDTNEFRSAQETLDNQIKRLKELDKLKPSKEDKSKNIYTTRTTSSDKGIVIGLGANSTKYDNRQQNADPQIQTAIFASKEWVPVSFGGMDLIVGAQGAYLLETTQEGQNTQNANGVTITSKFDKTTSGFDVDVYSGLNAQLGNTGLAVGLNAGVQYNSITSQIEGGKYQIGNGPWKNVETGNKIQQNLIGTGFTPNITYNNGMLQIKAGLSVNQLLDLDTNKFGKPKYTGKVQAGVKF